MVKSGSVSVDKGRRPTSSSLALWAEYALAKARPIPSVAPVMRIVFIGIWVEGLCDWVENRHGTALELFYRV